MQAECSGGFHFEGVLAFLRGTMRLSGCHLPVAEGNRGLERFGLVGYCAV